MLNGKKIIGLCTSRLGDNAMYEFIVEFNQRLHSKNYGLLIGNLCSDEEWLKDYMSSDTAVFDLFDYDVVDIVVMMDEKIKNKTVVNKVINDAFEHNIPVIAVDSQASGCITVNFDYKAGFEKVVRHVVEEHNVTDVHMMAGFPDSPFSNDRIDVFKDVLKEKGIAFTDDMLSYGYFWSEPTRAAMKELLKREKLPRAIVCANDVMAINVCSMLQENGYRVPQDVLVTGFDGIDEIFFTEPKITSCMCDYKNVAVELDEIIQEYFENKEVDTEHKIVPKFINGCSCGCDTADNKHRSISNFNVGFYRFQDSERALACIAERMQLSKTLDELTTKFIDDNLLNMSCALNKSCLDPSIVLEDGTAKNEFDETFVMICSHKRDQIPYEISRKNIFQEFSEMIDRGYPLVINALGSMNRLLGFVCFYYDCTDILSFEKIPSIVNALSNGIRGYMNVQRQIYLRDKMEQLYALDSLTGLYNRLGFNHEFEKLVKKLRENKDIVTVVLSDLDGLKKINDNYGHIAGDKAIIAIANALKASCPKGSLCVRLGGDEMLAVIVGECNPVEICNLINDYLENYNKTSELPCNVSTSLGVYVTSDPKMLEFDRLIMESDKAMYREKQIHHENF